MRFTRIHIAFSLALSVHLTSTYCHGDADVDCARSAVVDAQDRAFDAVGGRDVRNFPPDAQVKFRHVKLDLRMEEPKSKSFECTETMTFAAMGKAIKWIELDAVGLKINGVKDPDGNALSYRHDGERLLVRFARELAARGDSGIVIDYECRQPKRGMSFAVPDEAYKDRPVSIHTHAEPEDARYWFVCHDSPNARWTSETLVTVPEKYIVVGNGKLVSRKKISADLVQYHHVMEQPHVAYLQSLVIGELAMVRDTWRGRPVEYCVPPSMKEGIARTFGKTPKMMDLYSQLTGMEYPYAKYSQAVVYLFGAGGMENISATTLSERVVLDERMALDNDEESLISHELAHQWFGDVVTCKSWPHLWLNEGFATFMASVWFEHERGADEYAYRMWELLGRVADADSVDLSAGIVWPHYETPGQTFGRPGSNPYTKGAAAIHMLRHSLGDELFWRCIQEYLKRYAWKEAETDDLRKVIDELSGRSYERFFHQWLYRPGVPQIRVAYKWNEDAKEASVTFEQTQKIAKESPAFDVDIDLWLVYPDGSITKHTANMESRVGGLTVRCAVEPVQVCIDPRPALLAKWEMNLPEPMLVRTLKEGPTLGARLHAVKALRQKDSAAVREAMRGILMDEKADARVKREVAGALGKMQNEGARKILLEALDDKRVIEDHKVRAAAVRGLGHYRHAGVAPTLLRFARKDPTYTVEAAASEGLGRQAASDEIVAVLVENLGKRWGSEKMRAEVVGALVALDDARGVAPVMALAKYGQPWLIRPTAISALGTLGRKEQVRDKVREFLVGLLDDPQERAKSAAIGALGELRDPKAIVALAAVVDSSEPAERREQARRAIDAINKNTGEAGSILDLRARVEKLEKQREEMERRMMRGEKN